VTVTGGLLYNSSADSAPFPPFGDGDQLRGETPLTAVSWRRPAAQREGRTPTPPRRLDRNTARSGLRGQLQPRFPTS